MMKHPNQIPVLYIITKLELGGAQKVCLNLLQGLEKEGATPLLISGASGPLVASVEHKPNVMLLKSMEREFSINSVFNEIRCFVELTQQIKKLKKQYPNIIVHTHSTKAGLIGRWAAFFAGVKNRIHTVHGYAFHDHQPRLLWCIIYICELMTSFITTHFVCVSSEDVKIGIRLFPNFAKKHSIIRAAVETAPFYTPAQKINHFPESSSHFIFGTVACFKKQKNIFDLLYAFAYVHKNNQNARLEIIGDGILRKEIEEWIENNALKHAVTLLGWQAHVAPIMRTWHAFVLSSLWEGLPCAIVEARLLKLPVLSYQTGGIHDVIYDGSNGFLYPQKDWRSLAQGMLELTRNDELYSKLQSHDDDLKDFEVSHMVNDHISLYKKLLHSLPQN